MTLKRAIVLASQKGGVGKSTVAKAFIDLARRAGRRVSAWDLDRGTGSLALVYQVRDADVGCACEDVRATRAPGAWLDAFHGEADDVVLDVPGGAMGDLLRFCPGGADSLVDFVTKAGREFVLVSVIGTRRDSMTTAQDAVEAFGAPTHHVVVKNGVLATRRTSSFTTAMRTRFPARSGTARQPIWFAALAARWCSCRSSIRSRWTFLTSTR